MEFDRFYPLRDFLSPSHDISGWLYATERAPLGLESEVALIDLSSWFVQNPDNDSVSEHPMIREHALHEALSTDDIGEVIANIEDQLGEAPDETLILAGVNFFVLRDAFIDLASDDPETYLRAIGEPTDGAGKS